MRECSGNLLALNTDGVAVAVNAVVQSSKRSYLEPSGTIASRKWPDIDLLFGQLIIDNGLRFQRVSDENRTICIPEKDPIQLPFDLYLLPVAWTWWGPIDTQLLAQGIMRMSRLNGSVSFPHLEGEGERRGVWGRIEPILNAILPEDRFIAVTPTLTTTSRRLPLPHIPRQAARPVRGVGRYDRE